tara:strand:- start:51 stop:1745 length:1695 start_codon:yes stop_codon:yes gene_type:complete
MIYIENLTVKLPKVEALKNINLEVKAGQRLGLVGESGSGKTMLGLSLLGITPDLAINSGIIKINNLNMLNASEDEWTKLRLHRIAMVFQEPMSALNPIKRIGDILCEPIRIHQKISYSNSKKKALRLLEEVGLPEVEIKINQFPHELSGGQRQRVLIALALSCDPEILIADEPTSALDSNTALQITNLLVSLSKNRNMALVFISHDLNAVARTTQYLAVMFKGEILEKGPTKKILSNPQHGYTKGLIAARPNLEPKFKGLEGKRPRLIMMEDIFYSNEGKSTVTSHSSPSFLPDTKNQNLETNDEKHVPLLKVIDLSKSYKLPRKNLFERRCFLTAVNKVQFTLEHGQTLGIVGESGSGKSTIARLIMGFEKPDTGKVSVKGNDINKISQKKLRSLRSEFQIVFQDPFGSLDPRRKVGWSISEPLRAQTIGSTHKKLIAEALHQVGLKPDDADRYPHQFSGGQRQRIAIARALVSRPKILIADEAVSALDVSVQAQVLNLFIELQENLGLGVIFISHDLAVINSVCDDVLVMKDGNVVETGPTMEVINTPKDPYTIELLNSASA